MTHTFITIIIKTGQIKSQNVKTYKSIWKTRKKEEFLTAFGMNRKITQ